MIGRTRSAASGASRRRRRLVAGERLWLSAIGVVVVLVLALGYLYAGVLSRPITHRAVSVQVDLRNAGGLFVGSAVTYRGVTVGRVTDVSIGRTGVVATLSITSTDDIPRDSRAEVRSLSPIGEQYLDFQPTGTDGPYLVDGDVIPATSTDVPLSLASTIASVTKVLDQVDDRRLRSLLTDVAVGLQGTGDDLGRITDQGQALLDTLEQLQPTTHRLLRNSAPVLQIGIDERAQLVSLARHAKSLTAFLRAYDPELRRTIADGPGQLRTLTRLVADVRRVLPGFLDVGVSITDLLAARDPSVRALLQNYSPGFNVLPDHIRDGSLGLLAITDSDPRCSYGDPRRSPRDPHRYPMPTDLRCAASFAGLQRGAAHAPGEGG